MDSIIFWLTLGVVLSCASQVSCIVIVVVIFGRREKHWDRLDRANASGGVSSEIGEGMENCGDKLQTAGVSYPAVYLTDDHDALLMARETQRSREHEDIW